MAITIPDKTRQHSCKNNKYTLARITVSACCFLITKNSNLDILSSGVTSDCWVTLDKP